MEKAKILKEDDFIELAKEYHDMIGDPSKARASKV